MRTLAPLTRGGLDMLRGVCTPSCARNGPTGLTVHSNPASDQLAAVALHIAQVGRAACEAAVTAACPTLPHACSVRLTGLHVPLGRCALTEPLAAKRLRVAALIERLALQSCADTTIGDALSRGISGGQAISPACTRPHSLTAQCTSSCLELREVRVCICVW